MSAVDLATEASFNLGVGERLTPALGGPEYHSRSLIGTDVLFGGKWRLYGKIVQYTVLSNIGDLSRSLRWNC